MMILWIKIYTEHACKVINFEELTELLFDVSAVQTLLRTDRFFFFFSVEHMKKKASLLITQESQVNFWNCVLRRDLEQWWLVIHIHSIRIEHLAVNILWRLFFETWHGFGKKKTIQKWQRDNHFLFFSVEHMKKKNLSLGHTMN